MFDDTPAPPPPVLTRWFAPTATQYVTARWLWLRALGLIFFSAFYSLLFQIHGLIGPRGILPAGEHFSALREYAGPKAYWLAPTLLWFNASDHALDALVWIGMAASVALLFNFFPRTSIAIDALCFLSFIVAAQDFSSYHSARMPL